MPMDNSLECNSSYSDTTGSSWFYFKDETANFNANIMKNNNLKSFNFKFQVILNK